MKKTRKVAQPKKSPSITINIQSWATPIVGIVMLIFGLFGGYYGGPSRSVSERAGVEPQVNVPAPPENIAAGNAETMDYLISQARHFKGDPDAPVTLVEFGDFQ